MQADIIRFSVRGRTIGEIRELAQLEIWRFLADDLSQRADEPTVSSVMTATQIDTGTMDTPGLTISYYDAEIEVRL